ncbi:carbonic anhydrase [Cryobacterium sp. LW097]|nr:carbonic anhydrase [Cryobacterium sp. LW097]
MIREGGSRRRAATPHVRCGVLYAVRGVPMSARSWLTASALTVAAVTLIGCAQAAPAETAPTERPVAEPAHWSYDGDSGPESWAGLDDAFQACEAGTDQSPIDLPAAVPAPSTSIELSAEEAEGDVFDSGHAVEIETDGQGETLTFADDDYSLQQLHAHVPSEHTVAGQPAAAELHLVHADADGNLLVLGVLVTEGAASDALTPFIEAASHLADDEEVTLDLAAVLPASLENYEYSGSLTTPPCTEDVQWVVMGTPISMSAEQIGTLAGAHNHNARPTQPLGDRTVVGGAGEVEITG